MGSLIVLDILLTIYLAPAIVAFIRGHRNAVPIAIFSVFLNWTFIGWVLALVWSFSDNVKGAQQHGR